MGLVYCMLKELTLSLPENRYAGLPFSSSNGFTRDGTGVYPLKFCRLVCVNSATKGQWFLTQSASETVCQPGSAQNIDAKNVQAKI